MKHFLLLIFFFPFLIAAQQRTISNTIKDENGEPLPGVSIVIKGTSTGILTDIEGKYTIKVKEGDILVISYVGFKTREFLVTTTKLLFLGNNNSFNNVPNINNIQPNTNIKDSIVFDYQLFIGKDTTTIYKNGVNFEKEAKRIKYKGVKDDLIEAQTSLQNIKSKKNKIIVSNRPSNDYFKQFNDLHFNYSTSFDFSTANKLPRLQNQFVQGRPINGQNTWQKDDLLSWGGNINNLEYDNNNNLVAIGTGNGQPAKIFNPFDFLKVAYSFKNSLIISKRWQYWTFRTSFLHQRHQNIFPNQVDNQIDVQALITYQQKQKFDFNIIFNNLEQKLPNIGANWQSIVGNMYSTPISFDNQNNQNIAYSTQTDNPYFYKNIVPDNNTARNLSLGIAQNNILLAQTHYYNTYYFGYNLNYKINQKETTFGLAPAMVGSQVGRYTNRKVIDNLLQGSMFFDYKRKAYDYGFLKDYDVRLKYDYSYQNTALQRRDSEGFTMEGFLNNNNANFSQNTNIDLDRHTHSFLINFDVREIKGLENIIKLKTGARNYFSSTLLPKDYGYFLPHIDINFDVRILLRKLDNLFNWNVFYNWRHYNQLFFNFTYGTSLQEVSLLYNQFQFNSLQTKVENYAQYFESKELNWKNGLAPEKNKKLDMSLHYKWRKFTFNFTRFIHQKINMIVPILESNSFSLQNGIDVRNTGWEMKLEFDNHSVYRYNYQYSNRFRSIFIISRYNPIVSNLSAGRERVAIAGYQDVSTQAIVGQPLGVIVGSAYLRNGDGKKIIDAQGFPLVNNVPQILGNSNPDFVMTWLNSFEIKEFLFSVLLEYRQGGQVWNGTKNVLNYLGRSQQSADERNITNFVFDGVNVAGQINQIPVDFANAANGLSGNRFVRYGFAGIGEEAIESATSFRLREVNFSYNFTKYWKKLFPKSEGTFSIYAQNLLLYTPYSGVDPQTMLMNYQVGSGLDLFNMPAMRTFGGKVSIKF
ncbi:MAG: hypothetical protein EAZ44_04760 [Cytophagia bacterium]|nr:MAG: hypothetical protein EAZ44_04760 [Cytophagia bacterium]TAG39471.1 MAG: hypothetical protein EAZ31_09170 [Cytophagia bacterium]